MGDQPRVMRTRACPIGNPGRMSIEDEIPTCDDLIVAGPERLARVAAIFEQCLSLTEAQRTELLRNERAEVRKDVLSLLVADDRALNIDALRTHMGNGAPVDLEMPERIGKFTPECILGRGGMGVVYRATDPELDRPVALKVLSPLLANNAEQLRRFKREAMLLASFNHPNVATIYRLDTTEDGSQILVLEMIEGVTLARRLKDGLSVSESLRIGEQIATALEAVYTRGVIHRDLKPSNVMLCADDTVKVLDFGLARRKETMTRMMPEQPMPAPGTPGYMAPEQIRGDLVDHRADIFAFGATLFECLTGVRAFDGLQVQDRIKATQRGEPDWSALPPDTPPAIHRMLARSLTRDPDRRPQHIAEIRELITETLRSPSWRTERPALTVRNNLPNPFTSFVGRQGEIMRLSTLIERTRLLSLTGPGGCGKTRLGAELASWVGNDFPDGVWFVGLADLSDAEHVEQTVARVLSCEFHQGESIARTIAQEIGDKRLLLFLDNCEHVLDVCARLGATLLQSCPNLTLLTTSRQPLGVPGEQNYQIPSLGLPVDGMPNVEQARMFDAVRLFEERARHCGAPFELNERTLDAVVRICRRLDGIPLAIELAAPNVRMMSVETLASRLDDGFRVLVGHDRSGRARHQTLRATFDWSFQMLSDEQLRLLARLSVFAGGWTIDAAEAVCGHDGMPVLEILSQLVDRSLVLYVSATERYRLLAPVRVYAAERLDSDESDELRMRHMEFFLELAEDRAGQSMSAPLDELFTELANLRVALAMSQEDQIDPDLGLRLGVALHRFWFVRSWFAEGRAALDGALARRTGCDDELQGRALNAAGIFAWQLGDFPLARARYEHAMTIWQRLDNQREYAGSLANVGFLTHDEGASEAGIRAIVRAMQIYSDAGDMAGAARVQLNLGVTLEQTGDHTGARDHFESCLPVFEQLGDDHRIAVTHHNLGEVHARSGNQDAARRHYRKSLMGSLPLGDHHDAAMTLISLTRQLHACERFAPATTALGFAEAMSESVGGALPEGDQESQIGLGELLRDAMGPEEFELARQAGRAMMHAESQLEALDDAGCFDPA